MTVEKTRTGYSAYAEKFPVYTAGKSLEELKSNIWEAISLYLDGRRRPPDKKNIRIVARKSQ